MMVKCFSPDHYRQELFTTFDILSDDGQKVYVTPYLVANYLHGGEQVKNGNREFVTPLENKCSSWEWVTLDELVDLVQCEAQKAWIPIDPTWADTMKNVDYFSQFDLKHIVFAYNGTSSKYPLAAGDYKLPNQQTKDIQVSFKQNWEKIEPAFEVNLEPVKFFNLIPIPGRYNLYIKNKTGQAWYNNVLKVDSKNEAVMLLLEQASFKVLPFQTQQLTLGAYNKQHWLPQTDQVNLTITTQNYENQHQFELKTSKPIAVGFFNQLKNSAFLNQLKQGELQLSTQQLKFNLTIFGSVFAIAIGCLLIFKRRR